MPCYVLKAGDTPYVKIGWADEDVEARRLILQTAHWEDLTTIRVIDGLPSVERAMHRQFVDHKIKREWYRFHPDMLTFAPAPEADGRHAHASVIEAFGGVRPLAEGIEVNPKRAIHWPRRGIPAKYWPAVEAIAAAKGIPITANQLMHLPPTLPADAEMAA